MDSSSSIKNIEQFQIAIVEDDQELADSLKSAIEEIITSLGHQVKVNFYHDGVSSLKDLVKAKVDFVVLDLKLPDISGLDVFTIMQNAANEGTPTIILSGNLSEARPKEVSDTVFYLSKPASFERLRKYTRFILNQKLQSNSQEDSVIVSNF